MALEDRGLQAEQFAELPCGTENLSPYSNPAGYVDPPSYYQTEFDWQQQSQQSQHPGLQHQQQYMESERHYYTGYPGDGSEANTHSYVGYGAQPVAHTDFYPQSHGLWPAGSPTAPLATGQINQQHRFFSGIDLSQQAMAQQSGSPNGSNGKPKRRRVQTHSQRKAANVRERRRMFHLNEAFDELRKRLPAFNYEKRLSRIETLRLAMTYISFMKEVSVGRDPKCVKLKPHGSELSLLPHDGSNILMSHQSYSGSDNNDDSNMMNDDSDCSNDELSNHSGGN